MYNIAQSKDTDVVSDPAKNRSLMILKMFCSEKYVIRLFYIFEMGLKMAQRKI